MQLSKLSLRERELRGKGSGLAIGDLEITRAQRSSTGDNDVTLIRAYPSLVVAEWMAARDEIDLRDDGGDAKPAQEYSMPPPPRRLACAETWAGISETASVVEFPGLMAWVYSVPAGTDHVGGDVHYASVCPSCIVSRIALADVSGHGETVAALGDKLRELMQVYLRDLEQIALMRDLNQALRQDFSDHYATMVAVGWHGRRGLMVITNAGHPPPLWYRASRDEWTWLESHHPDVTGRLSGLPLGLLPDVTYDRVIVRPQPDDVVVLYSDGVSEATNSAGTELGRDGLLDLVRPIEDRSPEALGTRLAAALRTFREGEAPQDDQTIIVMQRSDS